MARNQISIENATVVGVEARQRPDGGNSIIMTVSVTGRNGAVTTVVASTGGQALQQKLQTFKQGDTVNLHGANLCAQKRQDGSVVGYTQLSRISRGVAGEPTNIELIALNAQVGQFVPQVKTSANGVEYVSINTSVYVRKGKDGKGIYLNIAGNAFKQSYLGDFEILAAARQGQRFTLILDNVSITASPQKGSPIVYGNITSVAENLPYTGQAQGGFVQQSAPQQYAPTPTPAPAPAQGAYQQQPAAPAPQQGYQQNAAPQSAPQMGSVFGDDDDIPF